MIQEEIIVIIILILLVSGGILFGILISNSTRDKRNYCNSFGGKFQDRLDSLDSNCYLYKNGAYIEYKIIEIDGELLLVK